jgi:hypothetical protein
MLLFASKATRNVDLVMETDIRRQNLWKQKIKQSLFILLYYIKQEHPTCGPNLNQNLEENSRNG